jgi:dUTP pyrophosphatase
MNTSAVIFKALDRNAIVPKRQTQGAAGYDLHSIAAGVVLPNQTMSIQTGFSLSIPFHFCGIILGRSGLAIKTAIEVKASYIKNGEEVIVHVHNYGDAPFHYEKSMRIAQLIFVQMDTDVEYVAYVPSK